MTSPLAAGRSRLRDVRLRTPLHVQLVALLLLLTLSGIAVSAIAGTTALRGYLLNQKDARLHSIGTDALAQVTHFAGRGPRQFSDPYTLGRETAFVSEILDADGNPIIPLSQPLGPGVPGPRLPPLDSSHAAKLTGKTFDLPAVTGNVPWRGYVIAGNDDSIFVAVPVDDVSRTVNRLLLINLFVGLVVLALLGALAAWGVRAGLRPLAQVQQTAEAIAGGDLSHRVPLEHPHTEVGRLAGAFNAMVDRIEVSFARQQESEHEARASEDRMRRFVGDASHELRTPLTSIRGFAELYRMGAVEDPKDLRRAMGRIESEAKRMGLLVDDLLMLARLDQQRPLQREPVDMLLLATDAVHDIGAIDGGSHPTELHLRLAAPGPASTTVIGDEARLRQVLTNLLGNAVSHTPGGTRIDVTLGNTDTELLVEVRDSGPGMAPDVAARVFERFFRADTSRSRSHDESDAAAPTGSGLGLSIVSALVAAHGGQVELRTAPDHGAAFLVRLPLASPERLAELPGPSQVAGTSWVQPAPLGAAEQEDHSERLPPLAGGPVGSDRAGLPGVR